MKEQMKERHQGIPIVAYTGIGHCDSKWGHEIVFLTDGFAAYAYGTRDASISRSGPVFTVSCKEVVGNEMRGDEVECDGEFTFDLTDDKTWGRGWSSVPEQLALLVCLGSPVEEGCPA